MPHYKAPALCFDLMEKVGKQVEVERHQWALKKHTATFNPVLSQIKNNGWMFEAEHNYMEDALDTHFAKAQDFHLSVPVDWFGWKGKTFKKIDWGGWVLPWWYVEIAQAFKTRMDNSPVFHDYQY